MLFTSVPTTWFGVFLFVFSHSSVRPANGPDEPRRASLRYTEHGVGSIRMLCRASNLLHLLPKLEADAGVLQRIRWKFLGGYVQEVIKMDESRFEMVGHLRGPDTAI